MTNADTLRETVDDIPDGDVDSVVWFEDKNGGHFVVEGDVEEEHEDALNDAGFVITGGIDIPGMTQVNVVVDDGGD